MFGGRDKTARIVAAGKEVLSLAAGQQPIAVVLKRDDALARLYAKSDFIPAGLGFDEAPSVKAPDDCAKPVLLAHHVRKYLAELRSKPSSIKVSLAAAGLVPEAPGDMMFAMVMGSLDDHNPGAFHKRQAQLVADFIESIPRLRAVLGQRPGDVASRCQALIEKFTEADWEAAETHMVASTKARAKPGAGSRARPCAQSARIACFYPAAQQRTVVGLSDDATAVVRGCIRRHDKTLFSGSAKKSEETPLHFPRACDGHIDVEGDLLACCGDLQHDEIRDSSNFVGFYRNLRGVLEGRSVCYGMIEREVCFVRRKRGGRGTWVSSVLADSTHELLLTVDCCGALVRAYSTATRALAGAAPLPRDAAESLGDYINFSFGMCRAGETLLVSAATGSVYAMSIPELLQSKSTPKAMKVYGKNVANAGVMAAMDEKTVVVAPFHGDDAPEHPSMRVLDLPTGKVKQVLAGHVSQPSVRRQHCGPHVVLSYDDTRSAKLWDLRTGVPQLSVEGSFMDAIAIPLGAAGCAAITSGRDECLRVWDLRQHLGGQCLYKMGTGNLVGKSLHWSDALNSLFVGTYSEHETTHGRFCSYRYGESLDHWGAGDESYNESESDEETTPLERLSREPWPKRAVHPRSAWELAFDHSEAPRLLMYPFGMTDIGAAGASGPAQSAVPAGGASSGSTGAEGSAGAAQSAVPAGSASSGSTGPEGASGALQSAASAASASIASTPDRAPPKVEAGSSEKGPAPAMLSTLPRTEDDWAGVGDIDMHFALKGFTDSEEAEEDEEEEDLFEDDLDEEEVMERTGGGTRQAVPGAAAPESKRARTLP